MSDWQKILKDDSIATLEKLARSSARENIDVEALAPAFDNFQMRITPEVLDLIKEVDDPIWKQYIPSVEELQITDGVIDSLDEDGDSPVPNITHRYPDRVLFLVSPVCATYCRFCTRRRKVGDPEKIPLNQYDSAFEYIRNHPEVRDVILSGGDPMMLSTAGSSTYSKNCARSRMSRSSASGAGSLRICPSGSRRNSARWCRNIIRSI